MEGRAQMNEGEDIIICRCEEVSRNTIEDTIEQGCDTLDSIKRRTRAGMGLCQGRTCQRLIAGLLRNKTGKPLEELKPPNFRPPFRPISLDLLAQEGYRLRKEDELRGDGK